MKLQTSVEETINRWIMWGSRVLFSLLKRSGKAPDLSCVIVTSLSCRAGWQSRIALWVLLCKSLIRHIHSFYIGVQFRRGSRRVSTRKFPRIFSNFVQVLCLRPYQYLLHDLALILLIVLGTGKELQVIFGERFCNCLRLTVDLCRDAMRHTRRCKLTTVVESYPSLKPSYLLKISH